ncbi:lysophospholipid acyltransferase family protein [Granulicella sibirica]|uniref:1-acyl-sn-glycerol-3-phosphate acyltransferase n=1 Tax=Granulicella sibirica TaxID=2479048 RepID=A0A4Q0T5Z6_9BACT|nr:lysophospholipid acyltransferase family protein [Granulicella sibirica]RXH57518.1 1-acyl-sn-glycerol-3-phosphate acyltransferase [Granulicella sibirica]
MFASFKFLFVLTALGPLAGIIGIPHARLIKDISPLYRVAMRIIRLALRAAGIKVDSIGLENVPKAESVIFMSNHVSNLDPPVLLPSLPGRSSVLLKKELMKIPILGTAMRMAQFVPVERGSRRESAAASVAAAAAALRSGLNILVYPEGTRSTDGRLSTFKKGPFFLAQQTLAPIVPIAISGTEHMLRKGSAAIVPGTARIQFLPAIYPSAFATRDELMRAVHASIAAALPAAMKPIALNV